jgi:hypothetical protein
MTPVVHSYRQPVILILSDTAAESVTGSYTLFLPEQWYQENGPVMSACRSHPNELPNDYAAGVFWLIRGLMVVGRATNRRNLRGKRPVAASPAACRGRSTERDNMVVNAARARALLLNMCDQYLQ